MSELVFILTDFSAPEVDTRPSALPRLAHLESLLSLADPSDLDADWRGWLVASAAPVDLRAFSIASIAGAAFRGGSITKPESTGYWLATPVHLFAGLDSVHLHPLGLLSLEAEEQKVLVSDFARVFSDSSWRLEPLAQRELLLSGAQFDATAADPSLFLGSDPSAGLPQGAGAAAVRRLGSEIEMWLHEHPLNLSRQARGQLPVTALWLWGAQAPRVPRSAAKLASPRLFGLDIYAQALWQLQSKEVSALSLGLEQIETLQRPLACDSVVLYQCASENGMISGLMRFEQQWLEPALRALRARRISMLRLIVGQRIFSATRLKLARFWKRARPWWEALA